MATGKNLFPTTCPIHGDGIWTALERKSYFKCGCNRYEFIDCPKCGAKRWLNLSFESGVFSTTGRDASRSSILDGQSNCRRSVDWGLETEVISEEETIEEAG